MILINDIGLIGNAIGTIPAMIELSKKNDLIVQYNPEAKQIMDMVPKKYGIQFCLKEELPVEFASVSHSHPVKQLDLSKSFALSTVYNLHMIQCHYQAVGLPIPKNIPRPELEFPDLEVPVYDFILAPFSRSLPPHQKWDSKNWEALVNMFPDLSFALFGNPIHDKADFFTAPNVTAEFGRPFTEVCNIMKKSRYGVISVVTGISHLAYALEVPNILLINQGSWGKNPEAICITDYIPDIPPEQMAAEIRKRTAI